MHVESGERTTRRLWLPAFYFLYYGAGACLAPFLPVYLRSIGLSPAHVGLLVSITPLMMLFGAPIWAGIADAFHRRRPVMLMAIGGAAAFTFFLSRTASPGILLFLIAGYALCNAPIVPLADSATLAHLGKDRDQYGRIRMWGGVAWGVIGPAIGWLTQRGGLEWPFYGFVVLMLLAFPISLRLPLDRARLAQPFWSALRSSMINRRWYVFLSAVFISGIALSAITNFLFLYLEDMGAGAEIMGLSLTVATLAELPFFAFTNKLVRRWGAPRLLLIGMAAFVLRFLLYSFIQNPWLVLAVQVLHGPSFCAVWVAGVTYADDLSPPGLGATAQSIFGATIMGLGAAAGGVISGALFGAVGPYWMFRILALIVLLGLVGFWIAHSAVERSRPTIS